jgi:hypothetical protein
MPSPTRILRSVCAFTTALVLSSVVAPLVAAEPIAPTAKIDLLADGLNPFTVWLQDTKQSDPRGVFSIKDGVLHITGDGLGCICTKADYRDYHLVAEFRWGERTWAGRVEKAKDTGILVHSYGEDGAYGGIWKRSIEAQVIEGGCGDFVVVRSSQPNPPPPVLALSAEVVEGPKMQWIWKEGGEKRRFEKGRVNWFGRDPDWQDVKGFRGKNDVESPAGEWTRMDVICRGDTITNVVNGTVVNRASEVSPAAGQVQIQTELAECFFRKLELWPLDKAPPAK